jgi:transposase
MGRARSGVVATWRERVARWRRSGLSITEFCGRERLSQASFFAWRKRLASSHTPPADRAERSGLAGGTGQKNASSRLLQLSPPAWPAAAIQIALPSGALVTLLPHAGSELVTAAIRAAMIAPAPEDRRC